MQNTLSHSESEGYAVLSRPYRMGDSVTESCVIHHSQASAEGILDAVRAAGLAGYLRHVALDGDGCVYVTAFLPPAAMVGLGELGEIAGLPMLECE